MFKHFGVLSLPIAILAVSVALLIREFNQDSGPAAGNESPLAITRSIKGDVKRKPETRLIWMDVKATQDLYRKDSVRTSDGSGASIRFSDGTVIEMGENSLIVLERSRDRVSVDFVSGNIFSKGSGKGLAIRSKGVTIEASSAEVELTAKAGVASVNVRSGEVQVATEAGKKLKIGENQGSTITEEGVGEVVEVPIKLLSPERNALVLTEGLGKSHLDFKWEKLTRKASDLILEVATDRDFRHKVKNIQAGERTLVTRVGLPPGQYYWRVSGPQGSLTEERAVELREKTPVRVLEPPRDTIVRFGSKPSRTIFKWLAPDYQDQFTIELASDPEFKTIIRTERVEGASQAMLELAEPGKLYWRVIASSSRGELKETSDPRGLTLKKIDKLEPPELLSPKPGEALLAKGGVTVPLRWSGLEDAKEYRLEIASDEAFSDVLATERVSLPQFDWKTDETGGFHWRVSVTNLDDQLSEAKKGQPFVIVSSSPIPILAPRDGEIFEYLVEKPQIDLKWEEERKASSYEIEIAREIGFKRIVAREKTGSTTLLAPGSLEDGVLFWRVRALEANGTPIRVSGIGSFGLKARELAAAPKLQSPQSGFLQLTPEEGDAEIEFEWEPVGSAREYELVLVPLKEGVSQPTGEEEGKIVKRFSENRGIVRKLASADYAWGVRSIDSHGRPGKLGALRKLGVKQEDVLAPPDDVEVMIEQTRE